jgi:hypothetical protein
MKLKPVNPPAPQRPHPTIGYIQPVRTQGGRTGKSGCLCLNRNYYSLKCCKGYLAQQGIGLIQSGSINIV